MKRVKIMLTAIILLGTVGGVLAIKAKRLNRMCTAPVPPSGSCAAVPCEGIAIGTTHLNQGSFRCYTPTVNGACPDFCELLRRTTTD